MARPSSAYIGDEFSSLQHDSHVGINMGAYDHLGGGSGGGSAAQYASASNSHRSPQASGSGSASRYQSGSMAPPLGPGPSSSTTGLGSLGFDSLDTHSASNAISTYASPRLAQAHAGGSSDGYDGSRYASNATLDPHRGGNGLARDAGLGRSLSMGHATHSTHRASTGSALHSGSHAATNNHPPTSAPYDQQHHLLGPTTSSSSSNSRVSSYAMGNSPGGGGSGSQGAGAMTSLSSALDLPSSSSTGHGNSNTASGTTAGMHRQPSNQHPNSLMPASHLGAGTGYGGSGSGSRRSSAILGGSSSAHYGSSAAPRSPNSTHDSLMPSAYSPNHTVGSQRYSTNLGSSALGRRNSGSSGGGTFMDLTPPGTGGLRESRGPSPNQPQRSQYDAQSLGGLGDTLPYAYTSSSSSAAYVNSGGAGSSAKHATGGNLRNSQGPPPRSSNAGNSDYGAASQSNNSNSWNQAASLSNSRSGAAATGESHRNIDVGVSGRTQTNAGLSSLRSSGLYGDLTSGIHPQASDQGNSYALPAPGDHSRRTSMRKEPSSHRPRRAVEGFRRVRDLDDLRPVMDKSTAAASGAAAIADGKAATAAAKTTIRRADPAGGFVSPLKALTAYLHHTYHLVNPAFFYELSFNPRRVLTKPSKPMQNDGYDNEDNDYILYVNDWLGTEEGHKYLILDTLGQGTFGQVVKCQDMTTHEIVAVKVIKNKPAYFNQSMMEVTVLEMLNGSWDPHDEHHILRLKDTFIHAKHLCLVFELLSSNLYELIKQNSFRGLSTSLVRVFTAQLLDALTVLYEARLIHCDLKPENILLKTLQTPSIKLVDFGSACHEKQTVYTYIQSRFYRSPEVLLGLPYSAAIDMWSLGCIAVELFLGLPLFPGTSEFNQVCRIVEMLGLPPQFMLDNGKQTGEFFQVFSDEFGRKSYRLKSLEQYSKEHNVQEQPSKKYFQATTLPDIIRTYPMSRKSGKSADVQKELANRNSFIDFVSGLLNMDPHERWTPQQAKLHPFITGEKFTKPFRPPATSFVPSSTALAKPKAPDAAKHPYGGLPQTSARPSGKSFQDAAAYNQHLAQQQAYNSAHQAAAARQAQPAINNPYAREEAAAAAAQAQHAEAQAHAKAQAQAAHAHAQAQAQAQAQAHAQAVAAQHYDVRQSLPPAASSSSSSAYYSQGGSSGGQRSDHRLSVIPPQLAKLGIDPSLGSGQSITSLVNREDSLREWERRQNGLAPSLGGGGGGSSSSSSKRRQSQYQQLDLLQQQAEMAGSGGTAWSSGWGLSAPSSSATGGPSGGSAVQSPQSGGFSVVVDGQERGGRIMPNPHDGQGSTSLASPSIAAPPAAYSSSSSLGGRYQPSHSASHHGSLPHHHLVGGGGSSSAGGGGASGGLSALSGLGMSSHSGGGYGGGAGGLAGLGSGAPSGGSGVV
ncbi:uncharacterized protein PFL1_03043 [Pseudozyma flocculosa PF-1]|uniref:Protein kinase domain-containing protein n=1 Tax=Pseudozyma flocculosa PF-1 TaxID=1277687 RepID=A0A061H9H7_9BASI|nr:uncharacterized protein PFL1_03043 [Pseudozyma flocculosa PF-1]EPQ29288.1 hypothetical protein PFL1_03043 [Pseudozyma flocculosa PF-1]